jgi:hypothetical protein
MEKVAHGEDAVAANGFCANEVVPRPRLGAGERLEWSWVIIRVCRLRIHTVPSI